MFISLFGVKVFIYLVINEMVFFSFFCFYFNFLFFLALTNPGALSIFHSLFFKVVCVYVANFEFVFTS